MAKRPKVLPPAQQPDVKPEVSVQEAPTPTIPKPAEPKTVEVQNGLKVEYF